MLPELLAEARWGRTPQLNADDEVVVHVQAHVTTDDVAALWEGLLERDDIHLRPADELRWTGRPLDALEPSAVVSRMGTSTGGQPSAPWAGPKGTSAEAVALWEHQWPDQAAFGLDGRTPREAAESIENHPRLELVLRELEFHAASVRRQGRPAPNMAAVRERLGMKLPPMVSILPVTA